MQFFFILELCQKKRKKRNKGKPCEIICSVVQDASNIYDTSICNIKLKDQMDIEDADKHNLQFLIKSLSDTNGSKIIIGLTKFLFLIICR